jgi:hypothetical membrane protein
MLLNCIDKVYPYLALAGTTLILVGTLISIIQYRGRKGERYSLFNHFISELGEKGVSQAAWGFNTGMMLGGWLFLPLIIVMGLRLSSLLGWIGTAFGLVAGVAAALVGVFSMERLTPHRRAAMTFFHSGLYCIIFYTIAIFAQPAAARVVPLGLNIVGILAIGSFGTFLLLLYAKPKTDETQPPNYILDPNVMPDRPRFWRTPILEWCIFFSIQIWFVAAAFLS